MDWRKIISTVLLYLFLAACNHREEPKQPGSQSPVLKEGEFEYDLQFLKKHDPALVILSSGNSRVIISPKYQGKFFTSSATGSRGRSFGWINYKAFGKEDAHMNAYGGENRLWLGPEGGKFSLFFKKKKKMVFDNWKTPAAFDKEEWNV